MSHDVRAIANLVLDVAAADGRTLSNMQINKIVYFLHADSLGALGVPLVSAKIEAWEHGPVFRELYSQFKRHSDGPISTRASSLDPVSGELKLVKPNLSSEELQFLRPLALRYSAMSASALRAQSHELGGPWDQVWNHETSTNATMRITDESILEWFGKGWKH